MDNIIIYNLINNNKFIKKVAKNKEKSQNFAIFNILILLERIN